MMEEIEKLQNAGARLPLQLNETIFKGYRGNGAPKPSTPMLGKSEANSPKRKNEGITIEHLHKLNSKNISAWNMNRMMNAMNTSLLTTLDEQLLDMTGEDDEEASNHITSENEAKVAAKKIYFNVTQPGSKYIYIEDLMRFLRDDEALKTIRQFDGAITTMTDSTGQLTPKEVRVSFNEVVEPHRRSNASARSSGIIGRSGEQVVVCSSNSQFKRNSTLMRMKTKSRLMDQQDIETKSSQKTPTSGLQGKGLADIEEDEFSSVE
nr:mechanosensitive ion channel protein 6-like [Tanacetum cinerariifolium]